MIGASPPPHPDAIREEPELAVIHVLDAALEMMWRTIASSSPGVLEEDELRRPPQTPTEWAQLIARQCFDLQGDLDRYVRQQERIRERRRVTECTEIFDR